MILIKGKQTITERVHQDLRDSILKGKYQSGQQLLQDELAAHYGVSRIPVREVLIQLAGEGLVSFTPYKGAEVVRLSFAELHEIYELRFLLESAALRCSIALMTDGDIQRIQKIIDEARESDDEENHSSLNWKFHMELYRLANRPRLLDLINAQHIAVDRYIRIYLNLMNYQDDSQKAHNDILQCCRLRDTAEAIVQLHEHLRTAYERICTYLFPEEKVAGSLKKDSSLLLPLMAPAPFSTKYEKQSEVKN